MTTSHRHEFMVVGVLLLCLFVWCVFMVFVYRSYVAASGLEAAIDTTAWSPESADVHSSVPSTLPRLLDGVIVDRKSANTLPLCVMIENAAFDGVRPQTGLSRASVVYEVIVEGGITRFMAVFASGAGESFPIGPVRSSRDTYLEFVSEYDCPYIHAGGSFTAMQAIRNFHLRDVDGLIEGKYFWREAGKYAPHNLFTTREKLEFAARDHAWTVRESDTFTPWRFLDAVPGASRTASETADAATRVSIQFGGSYDVLYTYDPSRNVYLRQNGGLAQSDALTREQIAPQNVIVQFVDAGDSIEGKGRINWPVTGEGRVEVFHDGRISTGRWKKTHREQRTVFVDESGAPLPLTRGSTWIAIVPPHISVSHE